MKRKIQILITATIALIIAISVLAVIINLGLRAIFFAIEHPMKNIIIVSFLIMAGWAINNRFFKD